MIWKSQKKKKKVPSLDIRVSSEAENYSLEKGTFSFEILILNITHLKPYHQKSTQEHACLGSLNIKIKPLNIQDYKISINFSKFT